MLRGLIESAGGTVPMTTDSVAIKKRVRTLSPLS